MPKAMSRRKFLKVALSVLGGAIASGPLAWLYATEVEPGWVENERLTIPIAGLPQALAGFTLAHFSDLHLGPHMSREGALRVIERVNMRHDLGHGSWSMAAWNPWRRFVLCGLWGPKDEVTDRREQTW